MGSCGSHVLVDPIARSIPFSMSSHKFDHNFGHKFDHNFGHKFREASLVMAIMAGRPPGAPEWAERPLGPSRRPVQDG